MEAEAGSHRETLRIKGGNNVVQGRDQLKARPRSGLKHYGRTLSCLALDKKLSQFVEHGLDCVYISTVSEVKDGIGFV